MVSNRSDIMAQAVYLAQLEAAKGKCKCDTCRILRRATKVMKDEMLGGTGSDNPGAGDPLTAGQVPGTGLLSLDEEED